MHKFFIEDNQITEGQICISGEDYMHITKSLRMKLGEKIEVSNGKGREYITKLSEIHKDSVILDILDELENNSETSIEINLYQGIPKGSKMDFIIQKSVELGVKNIIPVITRRTIVEIDKKSKKLERWQKISEEAAKQSKRGIIPQIKPVIKIMDMEDELSKNDINLIAYEGEQYVNLKQILCEHTIAKKIGVFIGPEGGLAEEEVEFLTSIGGIPISLGKRILRTETAGLSLLSMLIYQFEM